MLDHRSHTTKIPRFGNAPRTFVPPPTAGPRFSLTLDNTLRGPYAWSQVDDGQLLLRVRYLVNYDELAWAYAENLPGWAKKTLFGGLGVIDPTVNLVGYLATRYWGPEDVADHQGATMVEATAGLIPWKHDWLN